jgi:hypothetical protein
MTRGARTAIVLATTLLAACTSTNTREEEPAARPDAETTRDARTPRDAEATDAEATDAPTTPEDAAGPLDAGTTPSEDAATPMPRPIDRYLALGSSSTAGSGASTPAHAYVALIAARLTETNPNLDLENLGSGGATIDNFLNASDRITNFRPNVVTILPFTDVVRTDPARYRSGYIELFDLLGTLGATVFFGDPRVDPALVCGTGSGPGGCYSPEDRALLDAKSEIIRDLTRTRSHVIVVPVLDQNVAHPEWNAPDGHPNDLGHAYLADTFLAVLLPWAAGN